AELRAMAGRAFLRRLVLPQEDADVLLVQLLLEVAQEGKDSLEPSSARMQEPLALVRRQVARGDIHADAFLLREFGERAPLVLVASLGPGVDRPIAQGALGIGDDERLVVLENGAEAVALRAGAAR